MAEHRFCKPVVVGSTPTASFRNRATGRRFTGRWPSGQWHQTVNLTGLPYGGSNPSLPTHCGCSSMVEHLPSKQATRVRFPSPACPPLAAWRRLQTGMPSRQRQTRCFSSVVERVLGKDEVLGSTPRSSSRQTDLHHPLLRANLARHVCL